MLDTNPKLKKFIDALIDKPNVETKDIVQPIIEDELKKIRMIGVNIGFQGAMIQSYEKIKNMNSADEIKACLRAEADAVRKHMGLKSAFDENGNLIADGEESEN